MVKTSLRLWPCRTWRTKEVVYAKFAYTTRHGAIGRTDDDGLGRTTDDEGRRISAKHGAPIAAIVSTMSFLVRPLISSLTLLAPLRSLRSLRLKPLQIRCKIQQVEQEKQERKVAVLLYLLFSMRKQIQSRGERVEREMTDERGIRCRASVRLGSLPLGRSCG